MISPRDVVATLLPRIIYSSSCRYSNSRNCNSAWSRFGRWILAGVLIFFAIILFLGLCCIRRRRMRRSHPIVTPVAPMQNQPMGYNNNQNYAPPPNYGVPQQEYAAPQGPPPGNAGYYGQQSGVAQPGQTYQQGGFK